MIEAVPAFTCNYPGQIQAAAAPEAGAELEHLQGVGACLERLAAISRLALHAGQAVASVGLGTSAW